MKRLNLFLIIIIIILISISCAGVYKQAKFVSSQVYIGMPINEFKEIAGKKAKLAVMEHEYTVYKAHDYDAWTGIKIDTRFYYFKNGKLYKLDGGQFKQNRYQIEILNE